MIYLHEESGHQSRIQGCKLLPPARSLFTRAFGRSVPPMQPRVELYTPVYAAVAQQFVLHIEAASPLWGSTILKSIVILISELIAQHCMTSQTQV